MNRKGTLPIIVLLLLVSLSGQAQQAPYITVTDTEGIEHDLYNDYIRKGTSVMLSIFFSSCAPCQLIAEDLQALYVEWGEGQYDVEFIQVSSEDWETDVTAESYRTTLGLTFPVASADGGSLQAVDSLVNGGFGSFFGAPLYTVIGPDSLLEWNIFGFGNEETIEELDMALLRTGAEKPVVSSAPHVVLNDLVTIAPNPASQIAYLITPQGSSGLWHLYDLTGRQLGSGPIVQNGNTAITVEQFNSGTYVLNIELEESASSFLLMKQ